MFINGTDGNDEFLFRHNFIALIHSPSAWEYVHLGAGLNGKATVYLFHALLFLPAPIISIFPLFSILRITIDSNKDLEAMEQIFS